MINLTNAKEIAEQINALPLPFVKAYVSTLGGEHRPSVMVTVSFDERGKWINGILENSRYLKIHVDWTGKISLITKDYNLPKFRLTRAKNIADVLPALVRGLKKVCEF